MSEHTTNKVNATKEIDSTLKDSPPPTFFPSSVGLISESTTEKEIEVSQHLFNTTSTIIQQPLDVNLLENAQTLDEEIDLEPKEIIQQITREEGERGCVEQEQFSNILQNEQISNYAIVQKDISSQSNSQVHTSGQEAFQQKYQPVEVLNSEGEWVSGYWVHKCLIVANLEGVERKYALFDELGSKYVFLGEIRLPRIE